MSSLLPLLLKYLIGLIGISLVVLIHETGHLVLAKLCNIDIEVFSVGIGPKVLSTMVGETELRLSLLPIGGYCRLKGSDDLSRAIRYKSRSFNHVEDGSYFGAHPFARIATYFGGVIFNVLFAILLYALLATLPLPILSTEARVAPTNSYPALFGENESPSHEGGIRKGDVVVALSGSAIYDWEELEARLAASDGQEVFTVLRDGLELNLPVQAEIRDDGSARWGLTVIQDAVVGSIRPSSAEERSGLKRGDQIVAVNDLPVANHLDLISGLPTTGGAVTLQVIRDDQLFSVTFYPEVDDASRPVYQFSLQSALRKGSGHRFSLLLGIRQSLRIGRLTLKSLSSITEGNVREIHETVTGITRSALIIGDIASLGFEQNPVGGLHALLYLMGIVSISLAIMNLFPLPAFDGGQIVMAAYEWISGRPIKPRVYLTMQVIGLVMIILFFIFLGFSDLLYVIGLKR
jgi:regulator of sigma E protease